MRISLLLFYNLLLICTSTMAATGPETAQLLNRRYQSTVAECVGDNPAYFCSGVLLRASAPTVEFWKHGTVATQLGAESFAYVRADLGTRRVAANGVVFTDAFTAIGGGKTLEVVCAYPFDFPLPGTRPAFGCGLPAVAATQDANSCAALGIRDAPGWLAHFQQQNQQPERQCSLSSTLPVQFNASLTAHQGLGSEWSVRPTLLQLKNWDAQAPKQIPVDGLFYDSTQPGSLLGAQKDQRDYFNATGDWLPILRMDLNQGPDRVFGFNQQDQLYTGYQVASKLNARYADTAAACRGNTPAYNCNGVLIRAADASTSFHAWNPSPNSVSRNGVSFSYVRADVGTTTLAGSQGFTFKESFAPTSYSAIWRCAYPANASTSGIPDSCRASCESQGIITVEAWKTRYGTNPGSSCAFGVGQSQFQLSIDVRADFGNPQNRLSWNEIIIAAWPQDIPRQIPLETFYYPSGNAAGLANAKFIQRDYYQQTAQHLPIVRMNLSAADGRPFVYAPQDQTVGGDSIDEDITDFENQTWGGWERGAAALPQDWSIRQESNNRTLFNNTYGNDSAGVVLKKTITHLQIGQRYEFSIAATRLMLGSIAVPSLSLRTSQGEQSPTTELTATPQILKVEFTAQTAQTEVRIRSHQASGQGNDYEVDDLTIKRVP